MLAASATVLRAPKVVLERSCSINKLPMPSAADRLGGIPVVPSWVEFLTRDRIKPKSPATIGFAGVIAANVSQPKHPAEIANSAVVQSTTGDVSVTTLVHAVAFTTANGTATGNTATIGLAIGGNFAGGTNLARIGSATVSADDILVQAGESAMTSFRPRPWLGQPVLGPEYRAAIAANAGASTTQAQIANAPISLPPEIFRFYQPARCRVLPSRAAAPLV